VCVGPHITSLHSPIEQLSLDDKVGQLFAVVGHGVFMSESSLAYQRCCITCATTMSAA